MRRTFIQDPGVTTVLDDNFVGDENLRETEKAIMRGDGKTVAGTGGLKKIRCGSSGKGKSGSVRILFADYPQAGRVYLLAAFGKKDKSDLSGDERRDLASIKKILDEIMEGFSENEESQE